MSNQYGQLVQLDYEQTQNIRHRVRNAQSSQTVGKQAISSTTYSSPRYLPFWTESYALSFYQSILNGKADISLPVPLIYEEVMDDVLLPRGVALMTKSRFYHYCYHSTMSMQAQNFALQVVRTDGKAKHFQCSYFPFEGSPISDGPQYPASFLSSTTVKTARGEAMDTMVPQFRSDFDLSMFIWELKDFKHLVKLGIQLLNARRQWKALQFLQRKGQQLAGRGPSDALGSGFNLTVGAFLSYNLAYAPLLSDLRNMVEATQAFLKEAYEEFREDGTKFNTSYHSATAVPNAQVSQYGTYPCFLRGMLQWYKYTAFMSYKYTYPLKDSLARLIPYFGLDVTKEDVWNMIPLSFLLDYCLGVGRALALLDRSQDASILDPIFGESIALYTQSGMTLDTSKCYTGRVIIVNGQPVKGGYPLLAGYVVKDYLRLPRGEFARVLYPRLRKPKNRQMLIGMGVVMNLFK